eukprot:4774350-Pyramimonas_sp.AAC.3
MRPGRGSAEGIKGVHRDCRLDCRLDCCLDLDLIWRCSSSSGLGGGGGKVRGRVRRGFGGDWRHSSTSALAVAAARHYKKMSLEEAQRQSRGGS